VYAPVFLVWDTTLKKPHSDLASERIKSIITSLLPSVNLKPFVHVTYLTGDGDATADHLYKSDEFLSLALNTDTPASALLEFNLSDLPISAVKAEIEQDEFVDELMAEKFPPIVILVLNRQIADTSLADAAIKALIEHEEQPRIAIFGTATEFEWPLVDETVSSKKLLVNAFTSVVDEFSAAFEMVKPFVHNKVKEIADRALTSSKGLDTSPVVADEFKPKDSVRPVISISSTSPGCIDVVGPMEVQRPTISLTGRNEAAPIKTTSADPVLDQDVSGVETPNPSVKEMPMTRKERKRKNDLEEDIKKWQVEINKLSGKISDAESALGRGMQASPKDINPGSERTNQVTSEEISPVDQITADGQIVIDLPSSMGMRPWYSPNWKKLPHRGPSRDLEVDLGSLGSLCVIAGSTRGTKHQYYGQENQDAFHIAQTNDSKYLIVAVADGVGAQEYSSYGSRFVSHYVSEEIADLLDDTISIESGALHQLLRLTIGRASDRMQQWRPDDLYAPTKEPTHENKNIVSSTLCVAVVPVEANSDGNRMITIACVGDSPCYTLNGLAWNLRSGVTKDGEFLEHGTDALPCAIGDEPFIEYFGFNMSRSEVLVLMTDGIGTMLGSGNTAVGKWLAPRLCGPQLMTDFIQTLTADRQGEDDDRTLAVVYELEGIQKRSANDSVEAASLNKDVPPLDESQTTQ
jgi:serine/threonine protein phosphatase PrpC